MEPRLLKVPEVVELLGLSRAKVYELMASRELRSLRIAGARRVNSEDLEKFIAGLDDSWPTGAGDAVVRGRSRLGPVCQPQTPDRTLLHRRRQPQ
jgi:excisionase family DNA binding protein